MLSPSYRNFSPFTAQSYNIFEELTRGRRTETTVQNMVDKDEDGAENISDFWDKTKKRSARVETPYKQTTLFPPTPPPSNFPNSPEPIVSNPSPGVENNALDNTIADLQFDLNETPNDDQSITHKSLETPVAIKKLNEFKTPEKITKSSLERESRNQQQTNTVKFHMTPSLNQARQKANKIKIPPPVSPYQNPQTPSTPPSATKKNNSTNSSPVRVSIASSPNPPSNLKNSNYNNSSTAPSQPQPSFDNSTYINNQPNRNQSQYPLFSDGPINPTNYSGFPTNTENQYQSNFYQIPFSSKFGPNSKVSAYDNVPAVNKITIGLYNDQNEPKQDQFEQFGSYTESYQSMKKPKRPYRHRNKRYDSSSSDDEFKSTNQTAFDKYRKRINQSNSSENASVNQRFNSLNRYTDPDLNPQPIFNSQQSNQKHNNIELENDGDSDDIEITSIKPINQINEESTFKKSSYKKYKPHFNRDEGDIQRIQSPFKKQKVDDDDIKPPFSKQKVDDDDIKPSFKKQKIDDDDDIQRIHSPFRKQNVDDNIKPSFNKQKVDNDDDDIQIIQSPSKKQNVDDIPRQKSLFKQFDENHQRKQRISRLNQNDNDGFFPKNDSQKVQSNQKDDEDDSGFHFTPPPSKPESNQNKTTIKLEHFHEDQVSQAPIFKPDISFLNTSNDSIIHTNFDNTSFFSQPNPIINQNPLNHENNTSFFSQPNPIINQTINHFQSNNLTQSKYETNTSFSQPIQNNLSYTSNSIDNQFQSNSTLNQFQSNVENNSSFLSQPIQSNLQFQSNENAMNKQFSKRISRNPHDLQSGIFSLDSKQFNDNSEDENEIKIESQLLQNIKTPKSVKEQRKKETESNYKTPPRQVNKINRPNTNYNSFSNIMVSPAPDVNSPISFPLPTESSSDETFKQVTINGKDKQTEIIQHSREEINGMTETHNHITITEDVPLPLPDDTDYVMDSPKQIQSNEHRRHRRRKSTESNAHAIEIENNSDQSDFLEKMHNNSFPDYPSPLTTEENLLPLPSRGSSVDVSDNEELPVLDVVSDHMSPAVEIIKKNNYGVKKTYNQISQNYDPELDDLPIALRRTMRPRTQPLRFWKNERIIYRPDENGCLTQYAVQTDLEQSDEIDPLSPTSKETIKQIIKESNMVEKKKRTRKPKNDGNDGSEVIPKRVEPGVENDQQTYISFKGLEKKMLKSNEVEILPGKSIELDAKKSRIVVMFSGKGSAQIEYRNGKKWKMKQGGQAYICKGDFATISNIGTKKDPIHLFIINNN